MTTWFRAPALLSSSPLPLGFVGSDQNTAFSGFTLAKSVSIRNTKAPQKSHQFYMFHPVSLYQQPVPCTVWDTSLVSPPKNLGTNFLQKDLSISFLMKSHQSPNHIDILWEWKPTSYVGWHFLSNCFEAAAVPNSETREFLHPKIPFFSEV